MPGGAEEERGVIIATTPEGRRESAKTFGQMPEEVLRRAEEEGRKPNSAEKVLLKEAERRAARADARTEREEALLAKAKAILRETQIQQRGRPKKTRDELLAELEANPAFIAFQRDVKAAGRLRPSSITKVLRNAESLISKEYKQALIESMQRRARDKEEVIKAVRLEGLRKLIHEEDIFFGDGDKHNDYTLNELQRSIDEGHHARCSPHAAAERLAEMAVAGPPAAAAVAAMHTPRGARKALPVPPPPPATKPDAAAAHLPREGRRQQHEGQPPPSSER